MTTRVRVNWPHLVRRCEKTQLSPTAKINNLVGLVHIPVQVQKKLFQWRLKINVKEKAKDICPHHCGSSSSSGNIIPTSPPIICNDCTAEIASILKEEEWSCERLTTEFKHKHTDQVIIRENIYVKAIY